MCVFMLLSGILRRTLFHLFDVVAFFKLLKHAVLHHVRNKSSLGLSLVFIMLHPNVANLV